MQTKNKSRPNMQHSAYTNSIDLPYIFIKVQKEALKLCKMLKKWNFEKTGPICDQGFVSSNIHRTTIWKKVKKFSKVGQD